MDRRAEPEAIRRAVGRALDDPALAAPRCLVVAVSGGPDSVCLGHAVATWARARGCRVIAAHFDHRLRPDSKVDAEFVAALAADWGVEFELGRAEPEADIDSGRSPERWARRMRWGFLETCARRHAAAAILTAHHMGDQAETVLLRLLRGSGSTGLAGMSGLAAQFDPPRVRPLLGVRRAAIESYLAAHRLPRRNDPTNLEPTTDRNRIRLKVLPLLEEIRPGAQSTIARAAEILRAESELLDDLADAAWPAARVREYFGSFEFDCEGFAGLPATLQQVLLRSICTRLCGQAPRRSVLARACRFASGVGPGVLQLAAGIRLERSRGRCLLQPEDWEPPAAPPHQPIAPGDADPVSFLGYRFWLRQGVEPNPGGGRVALRLPSGAEGTELAAIDPSSKVLGSLPRWLRPASPGLFLRGRLIWGLGLGVVAARLPPEGSPTAFTLSWEPVN